MGCGKWWRIVIVACGLRTISGEFRKSQRGSRHEVTSHPAHGTEGKLAYTADPLSQGAGRTRRDAACSGEPRSSTSTIIGNRHVAGLLREPRRRARGGQRLVHTWHPDRGRHCVRRKVTGGPRGTTGQCRRGACCAVTEKRCGDGFSRSREDSQCAC